MSKDQNGASGEPAMKPSRTRRFLRFMAYATAAGVLTIYAANMLWKMSGSNRWELEFERNGVKVYSRKSKGADVKQYKAVMRAKYSLNHVAAGFIENSTIENCRKHIEGCVDMKVIDPWSPKTMSNTVLWRMGLPEPFSPREMIIRSQIRQDPKTRALVMDMISAPNSAPRNPGAVRVTHMHNRWTYTPVGNGEIEVEFSQDMDMGGMFPDILLNLAGAEETYKFLHDQFPTINRDELRNVKYDYIMEAEQ